MRRLFAAFSYALPLLLLSAGCASPEPEPAAETAAVDTLDAGLPLYFERIGQGQYGSLRDTTEQVIVEAARWAAYRDSLETPLPFKEVDFNQAMVVLAALPVTTGGYSVSFESVEQRGDTIVASYVVSEPGADCMTGLGRALPYEGVLIPRSDAPVRFEHRRELVPCAADSFF